MRSLQEHKPAWSLWKECTVVLCSSSTGTFERGVRLQHRGTHRSEALQRCHVLSCFTDAKTSEPKVFYKNIAFRTRSNPGRIISSALSSAATGWPGCCRSNRMDLFQVALFLDTQSEPPRSQAILDRKERPRDLWSQQSYQWLEHILPTPLQFQVLCNLSKTARRSGDLRETEILQHFGQLLENWLWSHPLGTYFSSGDFLWHCDLNFNLQKRAGWENPRIRVWCSEPGLGAASKTACVEDVCWSKHWRFLAKCQPQQPLVWQRPTLWTPTVWRSGKHTAGRSHLVVLGFLSCCGLHLRIHGSFQKTPRLQRLCHVF